MTDFIKTKISFRIFKEYLWHKINTLESLRLLLKCKQKYLSDTWKVSQ